MHPVVGSIEAIPEKPKTPTPCPQSEAGDLQFGCLSKPGDHGPGCMIELDGFDVPEGQGDNEDARKRPRTDALLVYRHCGDCLYPNVNTGSYQKKRRSYTRTGLRRFIRVRVGTTCMRRTFTSKCLMPILGSVRYNFGGSLTRLLRRSWHNWTSLFVDSGC